MTKKKMGARGKYQEWLTDEGLLKLQGWARDGLTDEQIAINVGISRSTLSAWKVNYSDIADALKEGKDVVDRQVENALLKSALGFHYQEESVTNTGEVVGVTKFERPNTTAQIFWLRNRKGLTWSNRDAIDAEKTIAEIEFIKERTKLLQGIEKDTGLLDALIEGRKAYEQNKR